MRPTTVTVGPLASGAATGIALSQTAAAAGYLAIAGAKAAGNSTTNIALAQTVTGATALLLNGSLVQSGVAWLATPASLQITSSGNDSGITLVIVGTVDPLGIVVTETVTGSNIGVVATKNIYRTVKSVTTSGSAAANVSVGTNGVATLDKARRVIITSGGNDAGVTFTINGTDRFGLPQNEAVTGASGGAASSVLDYLTVNAVQTSAASASTVTVGTNGIASSQWFNADAYAFGPIGIMAVVSGTANYSLELTNDDPNSPTNPVVPASMTWGTTASPSGMVTASTTQQAIMSAPFAWMRVTLNSGTGSVTTTFIQYAMVPA